MKFLKSSLFIAIAIILMLSCQKEYSLEDAGGTALGTLKSDTFGDCLPSSVNGIYKADSTLGTGNYIEVQINLTVAGSYSIVSDTINGYYFRGAGIIATPGLNTVKLLGNGKPITAGTNDFIISFGGSKCFVTVTVVGAATSIAQFTVGGSPGICTGAIAAGTYTQGVALNSSNTLTISVNVTATGAYTLGAASTNGMFFVSAGTFVTTGPQTVTLNGSGTPSSSGIIPVTAGSIGGTCTFIITVLPPVSTVAVYTLGGAPNNCTGVVLSGTYQAGLPASVSNTAKFDVTVTTIGTYTITTTSVNGISFSGAGSFTATGPQQVTLTASGTPIVAGPFNYPSTGNASACTFSITYTAAAPPAVFTLQGAPGVCTAAVVAGTYAASSPLTSANTVTIQANVTTMGSYTVTTTAINGMTFSATGVFTGTGAQPIVLTGSGTPTAAGTNTFTPGSGSTCTFDIVVTGAATNFITCKINGVFTTFNANAVGTLDNTAGFPILSIDGETIAGADPSISVGFAKTTGGNIAAGTYTVNQLLTGIALGAYYLDASSLEFLAESAVTTQTPPFTIVISSITATRVIGTFFGPLKDNAGAGPGLKTITEGIFNVPIQ